jgi:Lon protease-like protein
MQQDLLPLFPLRMVLLPGSPVALHIFEERYKEMVGKAIETHTEFGIVLASDKGIVNTGCTAVVRRVVEKYDDGRMDIVVSGRRRFEILFLNEDKAYLQAAVQFFDDDEDAAPDDLASAVQKAYDLLAKFKDEPEFDGAPKLSFRAAQMVDDLNLRQTLLGMRSEAARLKQLSEFLPGYVQRIADATRLRILAGRNGHGNKPVPE